MQSVADLVEESVVRGLATETDFNHGRHIADNGGVDFTELTPLKIGAFVDSASGPPCNAILESAPAGLTWHCTCSSSNALFCKHLVATALETWRKSAAGHA